MSKKGNMTITTVDVPFEQFRYLAMILCTIPAAFVYRQITDRTYRASCVPRQRFPVLGVDA